MQRWFGPGRASHVLWRTALYLLSALCLVPVVVIAVVAVRAPAGDEIVQLPRYLINTLLLVLASSGVAGVGGLLCAWIISRYNFPLRRFIEWALVLPFAVPAYVGAHAYTGLFDYTGPLQRLFRDGFGLPVGTYPIVNFAGFGALVFVMSCSLYPYVYIVMRGAFQQQSARILEAAQQLRGTRRLLFSAGLPVARPALIGALALVVMETLNEYGAAHYLGVDTISTGIVKAWSELFDIGTAVRLGIVSVLFILLLLAIERRLRGRARYESDLPARPPARTVRGVRGVALAAACSLPVLAGFVVPAAMLLSWVRHARFTFGSGHALIAASLNSLALVVVVALLCTIVALILAYGPRLTARRGDEIAARFGVIGYALPGSVVGLGILLVMGYNSPLPGQLLLTGSIVALAYGCVVRYIAVTYYPLHAGFSQVCNCFDETARSLGASPLGTLVRVDLPVLYRSLIGAALLVAFDILKDLPLTIMLHPFNYETLALRAFRLANDERLFDSAVPSLLILLFGMLLLLAVYRPTIHRVTK